MGLLILENAFIKNEFESDNTLLLASQIIHKQSVCHLHMSEYGADFLFEDYRNSGVYGFILRKKKGEIFICTNGYDYSHPF
jgi:hypothetical protein